MQVIVDDLITGYEKSGKGPQILILPGWADKVSNWQKFAAKLAGNYEVIVLDLPGFGVSEMPKAVWGLDNYAEFVEAFIRKIKIKPQVIIGHSNGGAIAIRGISSGTLLPGKLVLLASAGVRNQAKGKIRALRLATKTGKVLTSPLPAGAKKRLRRKVYETAGSDMLVAEHMQETFKKIVSDDIQADAAKINLPTLLIYGENDDATPVRYGEILHQAIDNSTLEILPGAEHFLYLDREKVILKAIEDFIK
jgi:pimeloyl-ACP methyl ester carboxylesterase